MKIRVFLADDHIVFRDGLVALLSLESEIEIVGQAGTARATLDGCTKVGIDVAVIDISMPGSGIKAIAGLRAARPEVRCLALTMHDDLAYVRAVLEAGGAGYLTKAAAGAELVAAIRQVAGGSTYITASLEPSSAKSASPALTATLSARESEVLVFVARGLSNTQIGVELGVTRKTVDTYRARVQNKLGLSGRVALVDFALRNGLL